MSPFQRLMHLRIVLLVAVAVVVNPTELRRRLVRRGIAPLLSVGLELEPEPLARSRVTLVAVALKETRLMQPVPRRKFSI